MTALQSVNLGTAPAGKDGDTVRSANVKANANVVVLSTQATLTSSSPNAVRDLTATDMGKRVNFTPTAASTVRFPAANTTGVDQIVSVHNLSGSYDITMAVATGSGDTPPGLVVVKPGERLTWETDGVSLWRTIGRKKGLDETVQGKLTVLGAATFTGGVAGNIAATGSLSGTSLITTNASISAAGAFSGVSGAYSGNVSSATLSVSGAATLGSSKVGTAAAWTGAVLDVSSNQAATGATVAASFGNGVASGPRLQVIPNTGGAYFNPIVGSGDVLLLATSGAGVGANLSICPNGTTAGGLRITADGNVSVGAVNIAGLYNGTASADGVGFGVDHGLYVQRKQAAGIWVSKNGNASGTWDSGLIQFYCNGAQIGGISTPSGTSVSYNTTSDYRIKTVVGMSLDALERVCAVPVYRGYYTADGEGAEHDLALAHEIAAQFPHVVTGEKDAVSIHPVYRDDCDPADVQPEDVLELREAIVPQQVDYSRLVMPLFAAVQKLKAMLDAATARIEKLEAAQ
ncbi:hypothetical protein [Paraburkholderia bannensis]|uniref:hypothetical protein n=1 Tax=Paraburkholderia bannensis TaxID=765414 RepID=UPI0004872837|nr:hypothetical protein [Paraburkholderia bannensis]